MYIWAGAWDKQGLSFGLQGFTPRSSPALGDDDAWEVKATASDSLMRFLQQINKQGLTMDFPLRSMSVFLFVRKPVLWMSGFETIRQTEAKLYTNRNLNIITVVAAALRINYQTPSTVFCLLHASSINSVLWPVYPLSIVFLCCVFTGKTLEVRSSVGQR